MVILMKVQNCFVVFSLGISKMGGGVLLLDKKYLLSQNLKRIYEFRTELN